MWCRRYYGYWGWGRNCVVEWGWCGSYGPGELLYIWLIIAVLRLFLIRLVRTGRDTFIGWMLGGFVWAVWLVFIRGSFSFIFYLSLVTTVRVYKVGYCLYSAVGQFDIVFTLGVVLLPRRGRTRLSIRSSFSVTILIPTFNIINAPWKWIRWVLQTVVWNGCL